MRASSGRGGWSSATPSNAPEPLPSARQTRHTLAMRYEYSHDEILADHAYERPLVLDGVPCHGGFVEGRYVSPRTLWRAPAIEAWQARLPAGELDAVLGPIGASVPAHFPSAAQTRLLVRHGVTVPLVRLLSLIAIVEGFGGDMLRLVALPPLGERVIEVFAVAAFRWAKEVLGDPALFRRHEEAQTLVGYIQQDEAPHVGYLATALAELRCRSLAGASGTVPGLEIVDRARDMI